MREITEVDSRLEAAAEGHSSAEDAARLSEKRFREVFDSSPVPMQIYSSKTRRMVAVNSALQKWLGYALEDIANEDDWMDNFYPDPEIRRSIRHLWALDTEGPGEKKEIATSPEHGVRAKDGLSRTAIGTMTRFGDESIIVWNDLTEIRRKEKASVEIEAHFRNMIEQSSVGIYVRRSGRFIYANPRYCEIIGYPREEVIGLDIHKVTTTDPENLKRIYDAWEKLEAGAPNVTYRVPLIRKDGVTIELELHAKRIDWDGRPADIVIVDDITERRNQEDRIAGYVQRLEDSMKSTLRAISHMLEMRDPYTAGHESRVGLIARDIAREMGWPEDRCAFLEMIGLVHDIGKIAVPSEILTKPGKLKQHEMALVHDHAQAGYEILKDVPFPVPVAEIIGQHHERMDGTGYPEGLKGEEILLEARILAVADVLETISSFRPYRPAHGLDVALAELNRNRGTLYDPDVVDAALRLFEEKGYKLPS
ncbi:MAG: PAS domain S-box protein [Deltaproteobacteria bacterium]|nr:PAS domain S-box protein [Deltaproteobacteria bacterium]